MSCCLACAFLLPFSGPCEVFPTQRLKTAIYSLGFQELSDILRMLRGKGLQLLVGLVFFSLFL